MVTGDHPLTAEAIARKVRGQTVRRPLQSNNKTNEKKSPSSVAPSFQLNRIALQVNIVHDFATREEIARGASVGGGGGAGVVMDPKAVPDEQVGAAVIDCR